MPHSQKRLLTSAMRRIFSIRSFSEKPRFLFNPLRILSPSRTWVKIPCSNSVFSRFRANVLLPDPESPVNQITKARCLRSDSFSNLSRKQSILGKILSGI